MKFDPKWEKVKLSDIIEFNPPKSEVKYLDMATQVSFVPMATVNENSISFTPQEKRTLEEVYSGYTFFKENDVLLAKVTPCFVNGKAGIAKNLVNGIGFGSSEFFVLRAKACLLPELLSDIGLEQSVLVSNSHTDSLLIEYLTLQQLKFVGMLSNIFL